MIGRAAGLMLCAIALLAPAGAQAASGDQWERAWGEDVIDNGGGNVGPEICTVAASCKVAATVAPALGGEFEGARDVALDPSNGDVYVLDATNQRVQKFDSDGNFLRMWGKDVSAAAGTGAERCVAGDPDPCQAPFPNLGTLGGEFNNPSGIEVDNNGNVYVTDARRVQKFNSNGFFLRAWGLDVDSSIAGSGFEICLSAGSCTAGAGSTGVAGEMCSPNGIGVDSSNNIYVADGCNTERVHKFDAQGNPLRLWGKDAVATGSPNDTGTGPEICIADQDICQASPTTTGLGGEFNDPIAVAVDPNDDVYVSDATGHRVQKFDTNGNFLRAWGEDVIFGNANTSGPEICVAGVDTCKNGLGATGDDLGGEFIIPAGIATDGLGNVYVSDFNNHRIQKFDTSGNFQRAWGQDVAIAGPGNTGVDFEICVAPADTCETGTNATPQLGAEMINPNGLDANPAGTLYVADQGNRRVQKFAADPVPETTIAASPATFATPTPGFEFSSDAGSTFECSVDGGAFAGCASPFTTPALADGAHTLAVRATDPARQVEATPATRGFAIDTTVPPPGDGGGGGGDGGGGDGGGGDATDTEPPETTIDSGPKAKRSGKATFEFSSDEDGASFECKLDRGDFARCTSPRKLKKLKAGKHTFQVRAIDAAGNEDATPAKRKFEIPRKKR